MPPKNRPNNETIRETVFLNDFNELQKEFILSNGVQSAADLEEFLKHPQIVNILDQIENKIEKKTETITIAPTERTEKLVILEKNRELIAKKTVKETQILKNENKINTNESLLAAINRLRDEILTAENQKEYTRKFAELQKLCQKAGIEPPVWEFVAKQRIGNRIVAMKNTQNYKVGPDGEGLAEIANDDSLVRKTIQNEFPDTPSNTIAKVNTRGLQKFITTFNLALGIPGNRLTSRSIEVLQKISERDFAKLAEHGLLNSKGNVQEGEEKRIFKFVADNKDELQRTSGKVNKEKLKWA